MKAFYLIVGLLLVGCAHIHEPKLSEVPKDTAKYETDKVSCRQEAKDRMQKSIKSHQTPLMAFGLLGALASNELTRSDPDDDYYKTHMEMTDECLVKKGYKID